MMWSLVPARDMGIHEEDQWFNRQEMNQLLNEEEEEEDELMRIVDTEEFQVVQPSHLFSGVGYGMFIWAKCSIAGIGILLFAPYSGAKKKGMKGCLEGIGTGLLASVSFPIVGAILATIRVGQGVYNTPDYVRRLFSGEYYQILGVSSSASPEEIRAAYYKLQLELSPNQNISDPNRERAFLRVREAYQVLSHYESRKRYDTFGKSGRPNRLWALIASIGPRHTFVVLSILIALYFARRNIMFTEKMTKLL